jgi:hypothetical protein
MAAPPPRISSGLQAQGLQLEDGADIPIDVSGAVGTISASSFIYS